MSRIARGVSLYSFQEEMFLGQMTVEDCIAFAAEIGAPGIEVLPEQNMPTFPDITDAQIGQWRDMLARHGAHFTCYDMFLDTKRRKDRLMTDDEQIESIHRDLVLANRLGITNMRVLIFVRPDILEKCVPLAEKLNVHMGVPLRWMKWKRRSIAAGRSARPRRLRSHWQAGYISPDWKSCDPFRHCQNPPARNSHQARRP